MDLELSDEQNWLSEAVETLLERKADELWPSLVEFGALSVGGDEGLGAVELCLIARALGSHLASVPYLGSVAVRFAAPAMAGDLAEDAVAPAVLEPGASWAAPPGLTAVEMVAGGQVVTGRKTAVEHAAAVPRLAVVAAAPHGPALCVVEVDAPGVACVPQLAFDPTAPMYAVELAGARLATEPLGADAIHH